jgi:hypothetical protein
VSSSTQKFFVDEKIKTQVHLIKPMNERWEIFLMSFERNFKTTKDVINVMAQTKWLMEDITYPHTIVKRFKEMVRAPREKKKS